MVVSTPERLGTGILTRYSWGDNAAYFNLSPNNHRRSRSNSVEVTPELIFDESRVRGSLLGIEIINASGYFEGIIDLSKFRRFGSDGKAGRVSPEQLLQVVGRMVSTEDKVSPDRAAPFIRAYLVGFFDRRKVLRLAQAEKI